LTNHTRQSRPCSGLHSGLRGCCSTLGGVDTWASTLREAEVF
jgi:hypothetical protein